MFQSPAPLTSTPLLGGAASVVGESPVGGQGGKPYQFGRPCVEQPLTPAERARLYRERKASGVTKSPSSKPAKPALVTGCFQTTTRCACQNQQGLDAGLDNMQCRAWLARPTFDVYREPPRPAAIVKATERPANLPADGALLPADASPKAPDTPV